MERFNNQTHMIIPACAVEPEIVSNQPRFNGLGFVNEISRQRIAIAIYFSVEQAFQWG